MFAVRSSRCVRSQRPKAFFSLQWQLTASKTTSSDSHSQTTTTTRPSPSLPWRARLLGALLSKVTRIAYRDDGTVNRCLLNLVSSNTPPKPDAPVDGVTTSDVSVDAARNLWFRLFVPETTSSSLPIVVYLHGGGYNLFSPASSMYDSLCRRFAREIPAVVVSVNYRLAPEHRYPSQYDDAFDVVSFLDQNDAVLPKNADRSRCFFAGDSAGGNLAHQLAVGVTRQKDRFRVVKLVGQISIQPFFGGEERVDSEIRILQSDLWRRDWLWKAFLPDGSDRNHEVVNVSGPNAADISGLEYPKTVVFVGGSDPLQDWQRKYYRWLKKSGKDAELIEYPNMIHGFYAFPELPESNHLVSRVKDFVSSV